MKLTVRAFRPEQQDIGRACAHNPQEHSASVSVVTAEIPLAHHVCERLRPFNRRVYDLRRSFYTSATIFLAFTSRRFTSSHWTFCMKASTYFAAAAP